MKQVEPEEMITFEKPTDLLAQADTYANDLPNINASATSSGRLTQALEECEDLV